MLHMLVVALLAAAVSAAETAESKCDCCCVKGLDISSFAPLACVMHDLSPDVNDKAQKEQCCGVVRHVAAMPCAAEAMSQSLLLSQALQIGSQQCGLSTLAEVALPETCPDKPKNVLDPSAANYLGCPIDTCGGVSASHLPAAGSDWELVGETPKSQEPKKSKRVTNARRAQWDMVFAALEASPSPDAWDTIKDHIYASPGPMPDYTMPDYDMPDYAKPMPDMPDYVKPMPDGDYVKPMPDMPDYVKPMPDMPDYVKPVPDYDYTAPGTYPDMGKPCDTSADCGAPGYCTCKMGSRGTKKMGSGKQLLFGSFMPKCFCSL